MGELFNVTHDAGNLNEYDSTVTDSGDLSSSAGSALAGTANGMQALIDDTTAIYGVKNGITTTDDYRIRFYFDPNSASGNTNDAVKLWENDVHWIWATYNGSVWQLTLNGYNDSYGTHSTSSYSITDAEHYIECHFHKSASAAANDGTMELFVDGVSQESVTGMDVFNVWDNDMIDAKFGAVTVDGAVSGTMYFDEYVMRDDSTEIGAVSSGRATKNTDPMPLGLRAGMSRGLTRVAA